MSTQDTTLPPLPDAEDAAHSATEEALSFGLSVELILKHMRSYGQQCAQAAIAAQAQQPAAVKESLTPQAQQAQGVPAATEYRRGWNECMALWADHMKRMNGALNAPSKVGYFNRAAELHQNVKAALAAAPQAEPQPEREPLSAAQVCQVAVDAGYDMATAGQRADFMNGLRHGEQAHGIGTKGGDK